MADKTVWQQLISDLMITEAGKELAKKFLVGGLAVGGGGALLTSYMNYLNGEKKDMEESSDDDDTLYIYRKGLKKQATLGTGDAGLSVASGAAGALAAYALVQKIYSEVMKRRAQERLDKAQVAFINAQGYDVDMDKKAGAGTDSESFNPLEMAMLGPLGIPLLLALGSGIASYKLLDKAHPLQKRKVKAPKRIEIVDNPNELPEAYRELSKAAGVTEEDDAKDLLYRMVTLVKSSSSDLTNLVHAVANGEGPAFVKAAKTIGFDEALCTVKGASSHPISPWKENLAIAYLCKSAYLQRPVELLAAAEFANMHPFFFKAACALPEGKREYLYKVAQQIGKLIRQGLFEESGLPKQASFLIDQATGSLQDKVMALLQEGDSEALNDLDDPQSSDLSGDDADPDPDSPSRKKGKKGKVKIIASSKSGRKLLQQIEGDEIDKILDPS